MFFFRFPRGHDYHHCPEQALVEAKRLLNHARKEYDDMSQALSNLQAKVAAQKDLITQVEALVNSMETTAAGGTSDADLDAVAASVQANNDKLQAILTPAPAPVTGTSGTSGAASGASTAGTVGGVNDGTQTGTASGTPT